MVRYNNKINYPVFVCICDHICEVVYLSIGVGVLDEHAAHVPWGKIKLPVILYNHSKVVGTGLHHSNGLGMTAWINKEDILVCVLWLPMCDERRKGSKFGIQIDYPIPSKNSAPLIFVHPFLWLRGKNIYFRGKNVYFQQGSSMIAITHTIIGADYMCG